MTTKNTYSNADIAHIDRTAVWHGFTQMAHYEPLVIERGEGNWLFDIEGRRLLDGVSSLWCNLHGHNHPTINAAIRDQLGKIAHVTSLGMIGRTAVELTGRLVDVTPEGLNHVFYSSDGSSSVEAALKMAFQYWQQRENPQPQKTKYVAMGAAYHGDTTGGVSLGGVEHFHSLFGPLLFDVLRGPCPDTYRLPENVTPETACDHYFETFRDLVTGQHQQIAAVVMEPLVQGAAGMVMHPEGFLRRVRDLTRELDILLICDEVATGFGRTGKMFACQHEQVSPDLMCIAKGLTGGYLPMAATLASDAVWNAFLGDLDQNKQFFHGHTYSGNPMAAAAGLASLDVFEEEQVLENLPAKIDHLERCLQPLASHRHVGSIRQRGLMVGIELVEEKASKQPFPAGQTRGARVCRHALDRGVWIRPLGNVIVLMPPLSIQADEIETLVEAVRYGISQEFPGE
ncbi:adenosylmethionine--8-amino-7-oxononanoate transaminase [Rosistilla oblonga]|uniref:Adenosylmethionine-8-amino-7-oxononanoate aminotransferase n=1 Tax=Rosistilla oblonga TaxID=2527990 RepID=A0A518IP76_9BACT|nr:adenosylmethionine--8-amino-7-oxononanoate transaminase [Rosistilla oblonga]QDV54903.1 L-Lysine-8-amino-7-oxononanoate aminotransferase [Rosistilla oblonga]